MDNIKKILTKSALGIVALIFILNVLANLFYWYTSIKGFDKFMHFWGGVFLALLGGFAFVRAAGKWSNRKIFLRLLAFVIFFGLAWEFYEYIVQFLIKGVEIANFKDSVGDLFFDTLGGIAGSFFVLGLKKRYNSRHDFK